MNRFGRVPAPVWIVTGLVLLFLALPMFVVIPISFSANIYLKFPPDNLSLRWYAAYFGAHNWLQATIFSLEVAAAVTVLATVLGTTAAFALVRARFPGKQLVYVLLLSPLIVPTIITAIAVYFLFARLHLIDSWAGLVLAHTILAIPFVTVILTTSLSGFDIALERAALGLGARPWYALRRVTLPIVAPAIATAALLAFLTSFDEVVIAIFIAGTRATTLPKKMWEGIWLEITPEIAAASTIVVAFTVVLFVAIELLQRRNERLIGR
ncbi:MAG TPA: ABC transporter permease [Stellaceae bacterium]|jgi:putative spermidine/putrescine transport system permease protein|nr:ABC transporter permease [Stellaceae bacterium]